MAGEPYTPDEIASLADPAMTHARFCARHPVPGRTWHAYRIKRNEMGLPARRGEAEAHSDTAHLRNDTADLPREPARTEFGTPAAPGPPEIVGATSDVDPDIEEIRRQAEARYAAKSKRAEQKRHQRVIFPHGPVALYFIGDQHIGSPGTDVARMYAEQDAILATPGAYVCLMGDLVDNYIVGRLIAENMNTGSTVWEQWQLAKHYLHRWGKRLIAVSSGNHAQWTTKLMGVDYDREITPSGVLYDADELLFTVRVGHRETVIRMRHKWRGNSMYSASHALERAARFDSSRPDVFVGAHVHQGATAREFILDGRRRLALMSSTYKRYDGYQRQEGFTSNDASTAVALVLNDTGTMWGSSDLLGVQDYMRAVYRDAA